jgi:PAS domain S-box-containing protein
MSASARVGWFKASVAKNYGIAVLIVAAAVALNLFLSRLFGSPSLDSLFLCAIVLAAWIGGTGPALLSLALVVLTIDYFFPQTLPSFRLLLMDAPRLALFIAVALAVVWISAGQRRAAASLWHLRDEQQATVSKLEVLNEALRLENSERQRAEERARQAERELQVTIDTIPVGAVRYRPDGSIDFANQTYRNFTGHSQGAPDGNRWGPATHPDDLPLVERQWRTHMESGEPFEVEQRIRSAGGDYRWHWVRRVPLRNDYGEVTAWYGAGYDIEDRKQTEDALRMSKDPFHHPPVTGANYQWKEEFLLSGKSGNERW